MATYDPTAGSTDAERIKIYVGGSEVSSATTLALIAPPAIQKDLYIGARYAGNGFFRGYIQDFRMYMDKVLTQAEVTNLNNNEITIDDISKGRIFVVQYALVWQSMAIKTHKFNVVGVILPVSKTKTHKYDLLNPLAPVLKTHRYKNVIEKTHKFNTGGPFAGFKTHKFNTIKAIGVTTKTHKYHKYIAVGTTTKTHKFHIVNAIETTFKTHKFDTIVVLTALTQVVRFQKDATGVNGATQDVSLSFTPKAILVFSDGGSLDNTVAAHYQWIQGFSDGTTHASVVAGTRDAQATTLAGRTLRTDSVFVRLDEAAPSTTVKVRASCSFGTNKVTFTWNVNDGVATYITMWAFGGTAITNAKVNTVDVGRTTAGTQNYTGLGFTPTSGNAALFTLTGHQQTANIMASNASAGFGCAVSSSKRWSFTNFSISGTADSASSHFFNTTECLLNQSAETATNFHADFDSWISDGFRLDHTVGPAASNQKFSYMVINGGTWDCGTLTAPASATNNVDTTVAAGSNTIKGLYLGGTGGTVFSGLGAAPACVVQGVTDATTKSIMSSIDEDNQATTDSYRLNNNVNIIRTLTTNGANMDVATFDSFGTNTFRLDWSAIAASGHLYSWIIVADQ